MEAHRTAVVNAARAAAHASNLGGSWRLAECLRSLRVAVAALESEEYRCAVVAAPPTSGAEPTETGNLATAGRRIRAARQTQAKREKLRAQAEP